MGLPSLQVEEPGPLPDGQESAPIALQAVVRPLAQQFGGMASLANDLVNLHNVLMRMAVILLVSPS